MIENPELLIKSDDLAAILRQVMDEENLTPKQKKQRYDQKTMQQHGEDIIATYVLDVLRNGWQADVELEMTYATLDKLPIALRHCLQVYCDDRRPLKQAAEPTAKSFAAYLFALGMNEHDAKLKVQQKATRFIEPSPNEGPLWANVMRITTGQNRQKDFLLPALEGGSGFVRGGRGLVLLNVMPAVRAYKAAFGVDLTEYGLCDMALEADVKE